MKPANDERELFRLKALTWCGMALFLLIVLVPFWWIASMSFKTYEQIQFATSIYVQQYSGYFVLASSFRILRDVLLLQPYYCIL